MIIALTLQQGVLDRWLRKALLLTTCPRALLTSYKPPKLLWYAITHGCPDTVSL